MAAVGNVSDLASVSDYLVVLIDGRGEVRYGSVTSHRRADGFWALVSAATSADLATTVPEEWRATLTALAAQLRSELLDDGR